MILWTSWHGIPEVINLDQSFNQCLGYKTSKTIRFADYANDWGMFVIRYHALFVAASFALPVAAAVAMFFLRPIPRLISLLVLMFCTAYVAFYVSRAIASST